MKRYASIVSLVVLLMPKGAWACATCFGAEGDPQTEGLNMAIITLLGVTYTLFTGMGVAAFLMWRKNQKRMMEEAEHELSVIEEAPTHG